MQKLSIYTSATNNFPLEDRIAAIKEVGYDSICLDFSYKQVGEMVWDNQVRLAHKYNLPIENAHLSGSGMNAVWEEGEKGELVTERLIDELKRMAAFGIKVGIVHVTWGRVAPPPPSELALHRYERAVEVAEQLGVTIALENSVFPEPLHYLLETIKSPNVGFCYDSGHEIGFTPEEDFLAKYGDRLVAMHLHDNVYQDDMHALPFTKDINWEEKVAALKKTDYFKKMITLECTFKHTDVVEGYAATIKAARKLASM